MKNIFLLLLVLISLPALCMNSVPKKIHEFREFNRTESEIYPALFAKLQRDEKFEKLKEEKNLLKQTMAQDLTQLTRLKLSNEIPIFLLSVPSEKGASTQTKPKKIQEIETLEFTIYKQNVQFKALKDQIAPFEQQDLAHKKWLVSIGVLPRKSQKRLISCNKRLILAPQNQK